MQEVGFVGLADRVHRLVRDDDAQCLAARRAQLQAGVVDLPLRHLAVLVPPRARRVEQDEQHVPELDDLLEPRPESAAEAVVGLECTTDDVEQRDVVVARDRHAASDLAACDEALRGVELRAARALRDVAREQQHVRRELLREAHERIDHGRHFGAEMRVGNLQEHTHRAILPRGAPVRAPRCTI